MRIAICGGGNLGHVCAGFLADGGHDISLLTSKPWQWAPVIDVVDGKGRQYKGKLDIVTADPQKAVGKAELVLICLPGYAIGEVLRQIRPFLPLHVPVGSIVGSTGFFSEAFGSLSPSQPLFAFQRVPFISRIMEYGRKAELKGYKEELRVAIEQLSEKEPLRALLQELFHTPVRLLDSYHEVELSNSNPLLHTSRLYTMWHDWKPGMDYERCPLFYAEWSLKASQLFLSMDAEFQQILQAIGVRHGSIPTVLDYYECTDAVSLTRKISTIPAFQGIAAPMRKEENGKFVPDFSSRYFTEDFPFGLRLIVETGRKANVKQPIMERVLQWGVQTRNYML